MDAASPLTRYAPLVEDPGALAAAIAAPLPPCIRVNRLRTEREALARLLAEYGVACEPVAWAPDALRLPGALNPGNLWAYRAGLYHVQEESSQLPVRLLDPAPGERVLDLCAAPGGKTAQIAQALAGRGTVIANERSRRRLAVLHDGMARLGLLNVSTTDLDGAHLPLAAGPFDKVLVDAPCSAEGRRRSGGETPMSPERFRRKVTRMQRLLLERAVRLTRPGGRIVYATCTLAPEENEAVVDAVLGAFGGELRVVPALVPGLAGDPGLDRWQGARFDPALRGALRLWPHRAGTSAFFACVLERAEGPMSDAPETAPPGRRVDVEAVGDRHGARHGLPDDAFDGLALFRRGKHVRAAAADHRIPAALSPVTVGIPLERAAADQPKLSTAAALALGREATRNIVELDAAQTAAYLARRTVTPAADQLASCTGPGYVIARRAGHPLGMALLREEDGRMVLESQFPKRHALPAPDGETAQ